MIGTDSDEPTLLVIKRLRDHRIVEILSLGGGTLEGHEFSTLDELARHTFSFSIVDLSMTNFFSWKNFIQAETKKDYFKVLSKRLVGDGKTNIIYPPHKDVFRAFEVCPIYNTKVVIVGMDPYHNPGEAHGLSFSVPDGVSIPPSLRNIYKELESDLGIKPASHGNLISWAKQGVLLLNSSLTVIQGKPGSHKDIGWHTFTDAAISVINEQDRSIVFMLWGAHAKKKRVLLNNPKHLILEGGHPSPLSSHLFFGGKYFSKANAFLIANNIPPINWKIE